MSPSPDITKKRVFFAPLNWGLGHAVRDIPIINALIDEGFDVILGGDGLSLAFLRKEFPLCQHVDLPSFEIRYAKADSQILAILKCLPKIVSVSRQEHQMLKKIVTELNIDIVISDNRFGLFPKKCTSVYITHQLTVKMPDGFRFLEPLIRWLHRQIISKYTYCWIPDTAGEPNLSGELSHKQKIPRNAAYIGALSRFGTSSPAPSPLERARGEAILFLLSGLEPQRTILEEKIIACCENASLKAVLVRGVQDNQNLPSQNSNLTIYNQLSGSELENLIRTSDIIVCRSGYTSIMEIVSLKKRAIFIPTPGQPEQEYLAKHLSSFFPWIRQRDFSLEKLLDTVGRTIDYSFSFEPDLFKKQLNLITKRN